MSPRLLQAILHRVSSAPPESDGELLRKFADTRDEPAFAELVRRYGGLVWGQCRHLLPSEADAEDAFQATFLALARNPEAVRSAVGPYLHGVAYRVCMNARRVAGRRKKRERVAANGEADRPVADSAWDTALAAVHDEVHRLPETQRTAFVVCVLEGRGLTDAAAQLGVKLGTLSARLSRAKQAVMDRLAARGVLAGMAALAALGGTAVSAAAIERAVQAAVGAAVVPQAVLCLVQGVSNMATSRTKLLAATVLLAVGLGMGVGSGFLANAQDKQKTDDLPRLLGEKVPDEQLADETTAEAKRLLSRLQKEKAERLLKEKGEPEFKYVPLLEDALENTAAFEKLVRQNEAAGYRFLGTVPIKGVRKSEKANLPTLVFRKTPTEKFTTISDDGRKIALDDERAQKLLQEKWLLQKEADLRLKQRWDQLAAEQDKLKAEADAARAKQKQLQDEIDALEAKLRKSKDGVVSASFDLGPKGKVIADAVFLAYEKRYGTQPNRPKLVYAGSTLTVEGDADAVKWATDIVKLLGVK